MTTNIDMTAAAALVKRWGIALTGGVATGKSTLATIIRDAGHPVIDADALARNVTAPGTPGLAVIAATFGRDYLNEDGTLARRRLGALVFSDAQAKATLEKITHPLIRAALGAELESIGIADRPRWFFYEAALVIETGKAKDFAAVWCTVCPAAVQEERLMRRDGIPVEAARRVIASQMPAQAKASAADVVIDTDRSPQEVKANVLRALANLR
jgi:dephospho-CoA kinase